MNQSAILFRLQNIDTQIDKINSRILEINSILGSDKSVHLAELSLNEIINKQQETTLLLQNIESSIQTIRIKIETNEASLYRGNIHNPKELQDLQIENGSLKKRITAMEEEQLDTMFVLEQVDQDIKIALDNVNHTKSNLFSKQAGLTGERTQIMSQKDNLFIERTALVGSILPDNINKYQQLRDQKRGVAVVRIDDNACSICGAELRPAEMQTARHPDQMAFCSSCGRILFIG